MITLFGGASLVVFALCVTGLVLHHRVMKKRWRIDAALELLDEMEASEAIEADKIAAEQEYEAAQADYDMSVSRFPGNVMKAILHLP
ncbi:MAG: hypothetical protein FWC71_09185 [Defluviitaleaceae bacterium]|nr:hypothetical protein [Defluviitaleaceae bacterium]